MWMKHINRDSTSNDYKICIKTTLQQMISIQQVANNAPF